jgi:hypothetical protein
MTASLRTSRSPFGSSIVRTSSPVSVGLCTIETGDTELAQRQAPWDFASTRPRCKSPQTRLYGGAHPTGMASPTSDPRWLQQRSSRDVTWSATRPQRSSVLLSERDSRPVGRHRPSATGASSGLTLNVHRIDEDRDNRIGPRRVTRK